MIAISRPTQADMLTFIGGGILSISRSRSPERVIATVATPDQKTSPRAPDHDRPSPDMTAKATYEFISMPGATTNGKFAHIPIAKEHNDDTMIVAQNTLVRSAPASCRIAGLTIIMYDIARKTETPPRPSFHKDDPRAETSKNSSTRRNTDDTSRAVFI
jgi:hypothetical protein